MTNIRASHFTLSEDTSRALSLSLPVVALESTVITHGLPRPQNLALARDMEQEIRTQGATPATIAVLDGNIHVGLTADELKMLADSSGDQSAEMRPTGLNSFTPMEWRLLKISRRDFATAITLKRSGGTTVAGTMFVANRVGIKVFATGGIGGVHDVETFDVSADLTTLADTPLVVVCAGAKAILDLPATLENLETLGVPVIGYQTDEFPAFYARQSGLPVSARLETPEEVVAFSKAHWEIGLKSAVLVCQPLPASEALPRDQIDGAIEKARQEASHKKIRGQALTPFLLQRLTELTDGASLRANLALLLNNAHLAAQIARGFSASQQRMA